MLAIDLTGRRALITGAARGIGAGIVRALAQAGADVTFTYTGSEKGRQAAEQLVAELQAAGSNVFAHIAAAEDMDQMSHVVAEAAEQMGGLDIVASNVGVTWVAPLESLDLAGWQRGIRLNLDTAFIAVKAALPWLLKAGRADVVLIGSSGALDGGGAASFYSAAKAGVEGMMRELVRELPRRGIRVNVIHPAVIDTDLLRQRYDDEEKRARLTSQIPVGRLGRPADIGNLVAYLCSDLGSYICGQAILVDGGRTFAR